MDPHQFKYWRRAANSDEYLANYGAVLADFPDAYTDFVFETEDPMLNTVDTKYKNYTAIHHWSVPGIGSRRTITYYSQDAYNSISNNQGMIPANRCYYYISDPNGGQ